jgi:hypothetical protein
MRRSLEVRCGEKDVNYAGGGGQQQLGIIEWLAGKKTRQVSPSSSFLSTEFTQELMGNLDYKFKWRVMLRLKTTRRHIRGTLTTGALLFGICDQRNEKILRNPPSLPC